MEDREQFRKRYYDDSRRFSYQTQRYFESSSSSSSRSYRRIEDGYRYNKYHSQEHLRFSRDKRKRFKKNASRPTSPIVGSEEYTNKKIEQTSAIIMRQLLSPEENIIPLKSNTDDFIPLESDNSQTIDRIEKPEPKNERKRTRSMGVSESDKTSFNVDEIHSKIMNHLSNLNDGRKKNFISTNTSVYDETIHTILKQKRLEFSRALRNVYMHTSNITESTEWINSIIPDMGIKIEDLPQEVLEALQNTFSNPEDFEAQSNPGDAEALPDYDLSETVDMSLNGSIIKTEDDEIPTEVVEILASDIANPMSPKKELDDEQPVEVRSQEEIIEIDEDSVDNIPEETSSQTIVSLPVFRSSPSNNVSSTSTQTRKLTIDDLLTRNFRKPPKYFSTAVKRMLQIDEYIAKLTEYRQQLFAGLKIRKVKRKENAATPARRSTEVKDNSSSCVVGVEANDLNKEQQAVSDSSENANCEQKHLKFRNVVEKMLVIKVCEDKLVAGTESGKIYFFSLEDGRRIKVLQVTSVPISCLHFTRAYQGKPYMFVGSFGSSLKVFNFYSTCLLQDIPFDDSVQCMDENWGYVFLGCMRGTILRYSIKKNSMEHEERFDGHPVFVLKATQEGARMVLLIGSRNSTVIIRDAMSGLHLRTMENIVTPTVYSIIMDKHFVYCGTTTHDILVYNFHNGKLTHTYKATNAKGIACMKVVGKCLFASCHNGKVYAYNLETNCHIGTLDGPGGVIISMELLKNQVCEEPWITYKSGIIDRLYYFNTIPPPPPIELQ